MGELLELLLSRRVVAVLVWGLLVCELDVSTAGIPTWMVLESSSLVGLLELLLSGIRRNLLKSASVVQLAVPETQYVRRGCRRVLFL